MISFVFIEFYPVLPEDVSVGADVIYITDIVGDRQKVLLLSAIEVYECL